MKKVLLINDDGPDSPGLRALIEPLSCLGELLVVVPEEAVGGRGKSITLLKPVEVRELALERPVNARFYVSTGTPADCFLIGLELLGGKPDLLVSGINMGPNLGIEDLLHSGTLGAAIQASLHGVPAIAASYGIGTGLPKPTPEQLKRDLALAADLVAKLASLVLEEGMPEGVDIISVNVPVGADRAKVMITELMREAFWSAVGEREGRFFMRPWAKRAWDGPAGTDAKALKEGYISITPVRLEVRCEKEAVEAFLARSRVIVA